MFPMVCYLIIYNTDNALRRKTRDPGSLPVIHETQW